MRDLMAWSETETRLEVRKMMLFGVRDRFDLQKVRAHILVLG